MVNRLFIRGRETGAASCSSISDIAVRLVCFLFIVIIPPSSMYKREFNSFMVNAILPLQQAINTYGGRYSAIHPLTQAIGVG
jgi:hypothetical protein